jgi:hypothetical protein
MRCRDARLTDGDELSEGPQRYTNRVDVVAVDGTRGPVLVDCVM